MGLACVGDWGVRSCGGRVVGRAVEVAQQSCDGDAVVVVAVVARTGSAHRRTLVGRGAKDAVVTCHCCAWVADVLAVNGPVDGHEGADLRRD